VLAAFIIREIALMMEAASDIAEDSLIFILAAVRTRKLIQK
jgi:hypothetical protein